MSIYIKGSPKEGTYKLTYQETNDKGTIAVLEGEGIAFIGQIVKSPHGRLIDVDETWPHALQQVENMPPELEITEREKNIVHTVIGRLLLQVPTVIEAE